MSVRVRYVVDDRIVYRVSEVAAMLSCDHRRIYQHIAAGSLLAIDVRPPGSPRATYRITRASLEAFLQGAEIIRTIDEALPAEVVG